MPPIALEQRQLIRRIATENPLWGEERIGNDCGGTKRRQQADIDRAKALHAEYTARKTPPPVRDNAENR